MPRWARISLITLGSLLVLIIILWLVLALVIRSNKQAILQEITEQLSSRLDGTIEIGDMEPSLIRSFPNVSVTLQNVSLKDSLYDVHQRPLVSIKEVFVKVNTFAIIRGKVDIRQVFLKDGSIRLFTDSSGYANTYLFQSKSPKKNKSGKQPSIRNIRMENMFVEIEDRVKKKLFQFDIRSLRGILQHSSADWKADLQLDVLVKSMAFNTLKGSYAQNKVLRSNMRLQFDKQNNILHIPSQTIRFDNQPVVFDGSFNFSQKPAVFALKVKADEIDFRLAASLLPRATSQKLDSINFSRPLNVLADINGRMQFRDTPLVKVTFNTKDNILIAKGIQLDQCSFSGGYLNEVEPGKGHHDGNSRVSLVAFRGLFDSIPIMADTLKVIDLKHPVLTGRFRSKFPLTYLTRPMGGELFDFTKGEANVDLEYAGSWDAKDTIPGYLRGIIQLSDGAFTYLPRNLGFQQCNATLEFTGADLFIRNVKMQSGKSSLMMDGSIRNLLNFYFATPEKLQLDWSVRSPMINLNEFSSFFTKRKKKAARSNASKQASRTRILKQLDVMMEESTVNMNVDLAKIQFQNFVAQNVKANVLMNADKIQLDKATLQAAGGSMQLSGILTQSDRVSVNARIQKVQIDQLFRAFDNFGLEGLTSKNLKGIFSATANVSGALKEDASLKPYSVHGKVDFSLDKGALINYEPLEKLGKFVFRKRDMSNVTFENIRNTLEIQGSKVIIHPMTIASSVINIEVEGVYGMPKGTNIHMKVPLRNPKGDELVMDGEELKKRRNRGIVLNLHAVDGDDGKVKIKLGKGKDDE